MATVEEEERREAVLDRWYFGRAHDRRFAGLGDGGGAGTVAAPTKKSARRQTTKHENKKGKPKSSGGGPEEAHHALDLDETVWQGPFFFLQLADTQLGFYDDNQVRLIFNNFKPIPIFLYFYFYFKK
jgi:hypothetical protein